MCQDSSIQRVWVWECASMTKPWIGPPCGCRRRRVRQLLRQPHPRSSEPDGAPATYGPRISLFAQCTHMDTQHKGCCRPYPVLQSPTVLLQPMVQGSPCLPNVRTWTLSTRDAVDHTLSAVNWNRVLGVNQLLSQGSKRTEGDLDGLQAQHRDSDKLPR